MSKYVKCSNCISCDLYENNITSNKYFCKITENFIDDIGQYYCEEFKKE